MQYLRPHTSPPHHFSWFFYRFAIFVSHIYNTYGITDPNSQLYLYLPIHLPHSSTWKLDIQFPTTLPHDVQLLILEFLADTNFLFPHFLWQYNTYCAQNYITNTASEYLTGKPITYLQPAPVRSYFIANVPIEHYKNAIPPPSRTQEFVEHKDYLDSDVAKTFQKLIPTNKTLQTVNHYQPNSWLYNHHLKSPYPIPPRLLRHQIDPQCQPQAEYLLDGQLHSAQLIRPATPTPDTPFNSPTCYRPTFYYAHTANLHNLQGFHDSHIVQSDPYYFLDRHSDNITSSPHLIPTHPLYSFTPSNWMYIYEFDYLRNRVHCRSNRPPTVNVRQPKALRTCNPIYPSTNTSEIDSDFTVKWNMTYLSDLYQVNDNDAPANPSQPQRLQQPSPNTKQLSQWFPTPYTIGFYTSIDVEANDYTWRKQLPKSEPTALIHDICPNSDHPCWLTARLHDDNLVKTMLPLLWPAQILFDPTAEPHPFPSPRYHQFPLAPRFNEASICYPERQFGSFGIINSKTPVFSYINLDHAQEILKPTTFLIHTYPATHHTVPSHHFFRPGYPHPQLIDVHIVPIDTRRPFPPLLAFLLSLSHAELIALFTYWFHLTPTIPIPDAEVLQSLRQRPNLDQEVTRQLYGKLELQHFANTATTTLTWRCYPTQLAPQTRFEQKLNVFYIQVDQYMQNHQSTSVQDTFHRFANVVRFHHHPNPDPEVNFTTIVKPITSDQIYPYEQHFPTLRPRHIEVPWDYLPMPANPTPALDPPYYSKIVVYCFLPHPDIPTMEDPNAPFNKLCQLLRQYLIYTYTPMRARFRPHYPKVAAQLDYLAQAIIPHFTNLGYDAESPNPTFPYQHIRCYTNRDPIPPDTDYYYNLATYKPLVLTLPALAIAHLQWIHEQHDLIPTPPTPTTLAPTT